MPIQENDVCKISAIAAAAPEVGVNCIGPVAGRRSPGRVKSTTSVIAEIHVPDTTERAGERSE